MLCLCVCVGGEGINSTDFVQFLQKYTYSAAEHYMGGGGIAGAACKVLAGVEG